MGKHKKFSYVRAFQEASADTFIATIINIPINYLLLKVVFSWGWTAWQATFFMTSIFMVISLARKVWIRKLFWKKYEK